MQIARAAPDPFRRAKGDMLNQKTPRTRTRVAIPAATAPRLHRSQPSPAPIGATQAGDAAPRR
ncbi:hypothetical protein LC55x_2356 [Lysobacter capsici]|nr:hypothetical protein LC55x_2356 [Lysobacter capsici]